MSLIESRQTILAIDPASKTTGWAIMTAQEIIDGGILRSSSKGTAINRIEQQIEALAEIIDAAKRGGVSECVIEIPGGKQGAKTGGRNVASLSVYGMAAGAIWATLRASGLHVHTVTPEWTRGITKQKRQQNVSYKWRASGYDVTMDSPDADLADAIGLGEWWLVTRKLKGA